MRAPGSARTATPKEPNMPTISHVEYVDRSTHEPDTLYVQPDGDVWMTPDGVGRIWLFEDAEQTVPMTELTARDETGITRIVHVEHTCDYEVCDMADGATRCSG